MTFKTTAIVGMAMILAASTAEARGLRCGATQMAHYGMTDQKYRLALAWNDQPHVSAQAGAVVVQRRNGRDSAGNPGGHVSRIVQMTSQCRAIVIDEKGRPYERDICSRLVAYVMPSGGIGGAMASGSTRRTRHAGRVQHASYSDRHSIQ